MQSFPLALLAQAVRARAQGGLDFVLKGPCDQVLLNSVGTLSHAGEHDLAFLANPKYLHEVAGCKAGVIVLKDEHRKAVFGDSYPRAMILCDDPYAWFAYAMQVVDSMVNAFTPGVHPKAIIDDSAVLEEGVRVDAGAVVGAKARVGKGAWIGANAVVGEGSSIGEGTRLHANCTVNAGCRVGARCILHSGCVIGADGFGFAPHGGQWVKIPQLGGVTIGDDVEIGANTCVDRGALEDTVIGKGTKLDNLIQIAHNVRVGEHCVMAGCASVAGSAKIGSHVIVGGAAKVNGHITIPDNVTVGPGTNIVTWDEKCQVMLGFYPAMERREFERGAAVLRHLPELRRRVIALEKALDGKP